MTGCMRGRMFYLCEDLLLLLLLPTNLHAGTSPCVDWKVVGRPHLRGSPRRLRHCVDLSLLLLVLGLWLPLISWDQDDQTLHGSDQVLHRLVPLGDLLVPKLDLYGSNYTFLRREHLGHATQAVSRRDLGFILY